MSTQELPRYWQSLAQQAGDPAVEAAAHQEFPEELPVGAAAVTSEPSSRRDFFKVMGLSATAALVACQRAPVQKVIPYVAKPDEVTPGLASFYASVCGGCATGCGVLLKTRDGRPIKVEGNEEHPVSGGSVCAAGQASVLSLYDADRAKFPTRAGTRITWDALDAEVRAGLAAAAKDGKAVRVVLPWLLGPTEEAAVRRLLAAVPGARTVRFDALGELEAIAEAHRLTHGERRVPDVRLDRARVVASFGADFLGGWLDPVGLTRQYAQARAVDAGRGMLRHWQLESVLSLTGTSADTRVPLAPSDVRPALATLVRALAAKAGRADVAAALPAEAPTRVDAKALGALAEELWAARAAGLVLSGSDDAGVQALVNTANALLGNEGTTLSLADGRRLDDAALTFAELLAELEQGAVGALVLAGGNPVYAHPAGARLGELLGKVALTVATADRRDETAGLAKLHAPQTHAYESWGDAPARANALALRQPAVGVLFETRSVTDSLLRWAGEKASAYDFLRARWEAEVLPRAAKAPASFLAFWEDSVRRGVAELAPAPAAALPAFRAEGLARALAEAPAPARGDVEVALYAKVALRDGALGNNGWLHELPDPVTKATWGNYAMLHPERARALGVTDGQVVELEVQGRKARLPALLQPGTHPDVVGVAVGYGRTKAGRVGDGVGENAYPLAQLVQGRTVRAGPAALRPTAERRALALTQTHHSLEGRPHVREATLAAFAAGPEAAFAKYAPHVLPAQKHGIKLSLWPGHEYKGNRWGMALDLNACTGCGACVIACQAENNIPVVGRDEVQRRREMHWLRIDRYYEGGVDNPRVVHQPMLCQHCENAPCETVCPALATMHSSDGLNQQIYNRCVGTRYCANNCPTKVRRFNWFDYKRGDALERMVLNPDVVVRSRGVMEKCSMCVHRIQEARATATRDGRTLAEGDVRTACQQTCPAQAIHFGDLNAQGSDVAAQAKSPRGYRLLEELNIGSAITYLAKIRNPGASGHE